MIVKHFGLETILGRAGIGQPYIDFEHSCAGACGNCIKRDWLLYLKGKAGLGQIEVSISCGVNFKDEADVDDFEFFRRRL
jgi:hypothetical protein